MKRQLLIYGGLAVFLITTVLWWFFNTFEYQEQVKDTGFSAEARRDQYLAAERFLKKFGMQTKSVTSMLQMKKLPSTSDVLVIPTGRYDLSSRRIKELMAWVRRGGHLVMRARRIHAGDTVGDDQFFRLLGVETHRKKKKGFFHSADVKAINVHVNDHIEDKKVTFDVDRWMKNTGKNSLSWNVKGKHGSQLLEFRIGDGYVSLLSDLQFMNNANIAKHNNAAFLYTLVHMSGDNRTMWIVRNDNMPSLLSIINQKAHASVVATIVLLLFWLWYTTRRFGPLRMPAGNVRRSLREHISASGLYQWRNRNRTALFLNVKSALAEQIAQTRPLWVQLDDKELAAKLAPVAGIPADRILPVLQSKVADKENEFTQYIEILSLIRKRL